MKNSKTLHSFAAASALNDTGSEMVKPFWPIFVASVLGAPMAFLGFIDGLGDAISQSIRFPAGYFSDKYRKRKIFIWFGYILAGFSRIGYAFSWAASWLIPFKVMDRMGKMRDPPRDAMLSEIAKKKKRGRAFGLLATADNFGAIIGPLLAFLLIIYIGYREIFLIAAIPSIIGAAVIYLFVKEEKYKAKKDFRFDYRKLSRNYKMLLLSSSVFSLSWFSISFMIVFATKYTGAVLAPLLLITMSVMASAVSVPAGMMSDRIGRKPVLLLGYLLFALTCLGFIFFMPEFAMLFSFGLFALYGIHYGIVNTVQSPFVSDITEKGIRASAIGLYQTITGICLLPASLIAGLLWDNISPAASFGFGLAVSLAGAAMLIIFVREK